MDNKQKQLRDEQISDAITDLLITLRADTDDMQHMWSRWDREKKKYEEQDKDMYFILKLHLESIGVALRNAKVVIEDWDGIV